MFVNESIEFRDLEAATLGHAMYLLNCTDRSNLSLEAIQTWLRVPIRLDQIILLFGANKTPEGYLTWAFVTPETAARLGDGSGRPPFPEEWNDGTLLWIVDVVAPFGQLRPLIEAARTHLGKDRRIFGYADRRLRKLRLRLRSTPVP